MSIQSITHGVEWSKSRKTTTADSIMSALKNAGSWMARKDIASTTGKDLSTVIIHLDRLANLNLIEGRLIPAPKSGRLKWEYRVKG